MVIHLAAALAGTLVARQVWVRLPLATISLGLVIAIYLSQSRASIASGALILTIVIHGLGSRSHGRSVMARVTGLVFLGTTALSVYLTFAEGRLSASRLFGEFFARAAIWEDRLELLQGAELLGLGPGGHRAGGTGEVHNLYLLILIDYGVAGLTIFFLLVALLMSYVTSVLSPKLSPAGKAISLTLMFVIINLLVAGFAQDALNPVISSHLFAVLIGAFSWVKWGTSSKSSSST